MTYRSLTAAGLTALTLALPAQAQVFGPEPVGAGWSSVNLTSPEIEGFFRISWVVKAGLGNLTVVCGAWAADDPAFAPLATAALSQSSATENGRVLLSSLSHFANAGTLDQLEGSAAPCAQTTAVSVGGVKVEIYQGEVLVPAAAAPSPTADGNDDASVPATDTPSDDTQ